MCVISVHVLVLRFILHSPPNWNCVRISYLFLGLFVRFVSDDLRVEGLATGPGNDQQDTERFEDNIDTRYQVSSIKEYNVCSMHTCTAVQLYGQASGQGQAGPMDRLQTNKARRSSTTLNIHFHKNVIHWCLI